MPVAFQDPEPKGVPKSSESEQPAKRPRQAIRFAEEDGASDRVRLTQQKERISLTARDAPLSTVLAMIAEQHGLNIVSGEEVSHKISVTLTDVNLEDALDAILSINGYAWVQHKDIVTVSAVSSEKKRSPAVQGRQVRVFTLNFVSAVEVEKVITGLLSPVGQVFMHQTSPTDQRRTHEQIVVEDLPPYVRRVEAYLRQTDTPPKQVVIEAHVLQVTLKGDYKHGVNFQQMLRIANADLALSAAGFANAATLPASFFRIGGTDLNALVEALNTTTDAKTLASPKVAVLNGQDAHLQIGSKLGFLLTTTTQTSTLQSVNFLDVGVILKVTPLITQDGQILMQVKPQVSEGRINPTTNLPESNTTEVDTKVMLADGEALVIGGLIKETDTEVQNKIPWVGDSWLIGRLFQRRSIVRERNEIIITLLPRIVPEAAYFRMEDPAEIEQSLTPLLSGPLERIDRTEWEPEMRSCYHRHNSVQRPMIQIEDHRPIGPVPALPPEELPAAPALEAPTSSRRAAPAEVEPANYETQGEYRFPPPASNQVPQRLPPA